MKTSYLTLVMLLTASTLFAQIFVKENANGSNDGSSWDNAFTSLSDAIEAANAEDDIWVAAGTYKAGNAGADPASTYFSINKKIGLYGGFAGTETTTDEREVSANPTTLSGDLNGDDTPNDFENNRSDNGYHVLVLDTLIEGFIIDGFIIEGGQAKIGEIPMDAEIEEWSGGGVLAKGSCVVNQCIFRQNAGAISASFFSTGGDHVVVENSQFRNNLSTFGSFGMENHQTARLSDCVFEENKAEEFGGAATIGNTNVDILNCQFSNNSANEEGGGGLFIFQNNFSLIPDPNVLIEGCTFFQNSAPNAGGMLLNNFADGTQLTVLDCVFENNEATASDGRAGGLGLRNRVGGSGASNLDAVISNCAFIGNTAYDAGGAYCWGGDFNFYLDVLDCEFVENVSEYTAGGLEIFSFNNGRVFANIERTEFRKNTANDSGAGLTIISDNPTFRINANVNDCVFEENTTPGLGAAITTAPGSSGFNPGPIVTISNSEFTDNEAEAAFGALWASETILTISDSHFEGNSTLGDLGGGGAVGLMGNEETLIERTTFLGNSSGENGGAFYQSTGMRMAQFDNVIFQENEGENAIYTEDTVMLRNVTFVANESSLYTGGDEAVIIVQNTIFADDGKNFDSEDDVEMISQGGNISNDFSLSSELTGANGYDDQHGISPMLDGGLKPVMGSPCVDRGNPDGIENDATDAAGDMRIQGTSVDVGAYETDFEITSVNDTELSSSLSIFPNPFSTYFTVSAEAQPEAIRVFDTKGSLVETLLPSGGQFHIRQQLAPGQYHVEMIFEDEVVHKNLIKE